MSDSVWAKLPPAGTGQRIGLLGGSFNPPHSGHRHISLLALRALQLDAIWWLVTPGNPLKDHSELDGLGARIAKAEALSRHPRIRVTGFEAEAGTAFTADTLALVQRRRPDLLFVWLMGADNLATFHHWNRWRKIAETMPIVVIDRPGATYAALGSPMASAFRRSRVVGSDIPQLAALRPPAWTFILGPLSPESSTRLRQDEHGHRPGRPST